MRILTATVLSLLSLALSAADELSVAKEALRDGLWDVARNHAARVASDEAKLVILESLSGEGRWDEIGKRLAGWKDVKGAGFDYYRAIVRGDHAAAIKILKEGGSPEGLVEARLFEANEIAKAGRTNEAAAIWRDIVVQTNVGARAFALAAANLMDGAILRRAYAEVKGSALRRSIGLRLGTVLLRDPSTAEEGELLVRAIVKDSPDAEGAREAFLAVADMKLAACRWKEASDTYHAAIEIWPDMAKVQCVQDGRGWAFRNLGKKDEALDAFRRAEELAKDDETRAAAKVKVGDQLQEMGRGEDALTEYRTVLEKFSSTEVAKSLRKVVSILELEAKGREHYRRFEFGAAQEAFEAVAKEDASRRPRMEFFGVLCLYGQGRDDEAGEKAKQLVADCVDGTVRCDATLWLAKFLYDRRDWKAAGRLFEDFAGQQVSAASAADALLWSARAAFADSDFARAIQQTTRIVERYADTKSKMPALLVQGEALVEQGRFDEAVLIFDRVTVSDGLASEDLVRAQTLKADALYAMGADNPARYAAALDAYRAIRFGGTLSPSDQIVISFKIARVLEKLKRMDEALDLYYSQVVLAYREGRLGNGRFTDAARAAFSRAAFRLADEYESRGKDRQAASVLELLVQSDVPAADEAAKRLGRILKKGRIL